MLSVLCVIGARTDRTLNVLLQQLPEKPAWEPRRVPGDAPGNEGEYEGIRARFGHSLGETWRCPSQPDPEPGIQNGMVQNTFTYII